MVVSPVSTTYDGQGHGTTGTVTGIGGVVLGPATISYNTGDGNAPVNAGSYVATGSFAGNGNYTSATGTAQIVIAVASTMITVESSPSDFSVYGQPVTFTAKVSPQYANGPTGTVTLRDGNGPTFTA